MKCISKYMSSDSNPHANIDDTQSESLVEPKRTRCQWYFLNLASQKGKLDGIFAQCRESRTNVSVECVHRTRCLHYRIRVTHIRECTSRGFACMWFQCKPEALMSRSFGRACSPGMKLLTNENCKNCDDYEDYTRTTRARTRTRTMTITQTVGELAPA